MATVTVRELTKDFPGGVRALDALGLTVADGEFFALLGPSGCGKTTLLRTIAGLEHATSGSVLIGDVDVTRLSPGRRDVGMVFQDYALFPHMTVTDNIAYPLRIKRKGKTERHKAAAEVAASLGLDGLLDRRPGELSGGQQQRVAIARALINQPEILLADEPTGNLDSRTSVEIMAIFQQLNDRGITVIMVTHEPDIAAYAKRNVMMRDGVIRDDRLVSQRTGAASQLENGTPQSQTESGTNVTNP